MEDPLRRVKAVADYQFGKGVGEALFNGNIDIHFSKRTGRIRYIFLDEKRIATMRPTDGLLSLSITGARRVARNASLVKCFVTVRNDVSKYIAEGGDVFAAHVIQSDDEIRSKDEVIVVDESGQVLAVGKAVLSGEEMKAFKRGVAVKVRHGCMEEG